MILKGGKYSLDSADDTIHSNANITISDGEFTLASGDDGIHADSATTISGGTIDITESYENPVRQAEYLYSLIESEVK